MMTEIMSIPKSAVKKLQLQCKHVSHNRCLFPHCSKNVFVGFHTVFWIHAMRCVLCESLPVWLDQNVELLLEGVT
jgi:hypothetical protein